VFTKVCNGAGGYEPGELILNDRSGITLEQYKLLQKKVRDANFWNLATENNDAGCDGSEWIIEAIAEGKYHVTSRWSPVDTKNPYQALGEYFLSISKIDKSELKEFY
jgi:hypothetical protein